MVRLASDTRAESRFPTAWQVARAKREIELEDLGAAKRLAESSRSRDSLPSEHPDHVCGLMCDGQDGSNSQCARLRTKLFGDA